MKLKTIKTSKDKRLITLGFETEGGYVRYTLSESEYHRIGSPLISDELDDDACEILLSLAEYNKAKKKALSILAYADNSRYALVGKLIRSGIKPEVARETADEMLSLGYIDEKRQLYRLVEYEANSLKSGPRKLLLKLKSKGYSESMISKVLNELCEEEIISFDKIKKELCAKAESNEEKRKILYNHGF